ncbi:MAG: LLM class flavin-dependent oxidoreductase [Microbacterium sp.]
MSTRISLLLDSTAAPEFTLPIAETAARVGIGRIWISEDYWRKGAFSTAGAILAHSPGLEVGLGVASLLVRSPAVLGMEVATIDRMFPGRFICGVGLGSPRALRQLDLMPEKMIGATRDHLDVLRRISRGEPVTWSDPTHTLDEVELEHPADGRSRFYLAASSPQMLRLAATHADGLILSIMSGPGYLAFVRDEIAATVEARPRPLPTTAFMYVSCEDDAQLAFERARDFVAATLLQRPRTSVMQTRSGVAHLLDGLLDGDPSTLAARMPREVVDEFVVNGTPEVVRARLQDHGSLGVDEIAIRPIGDGASAGGYLRIAEQDIWR